MNVSAPSTSFASPKESLFTKRVPFRENQTSNICKRVQRTYKKFKEKPLPPPFNTKIDGPSAIWKVFNRLQMATDYAESYAKDCMVFSFEDKVGNEGQRMFLVAHPEQMWQKHRARELEDRCSYEIIRENYPSKLYFDLEFYTSFNKEKNGNDMTKIFIQCVIASMFEQHNMPLKWSSFLWLDASNEQKFSSHLILQMKDVAFQNNIEAGTFVSILTSTLRKRIESNMPAKDLWPSADQIKTLCVKSKKEKDIFFCDEGVYSKNRNFRMFLSTKHGKKSPLLLSECNEYAPFVSAKCKDEGAVFYDSLITYFRDTKITRFLNYDENIHFNIYSPASFKRMRTNKQDVSGTTSSPFSDVDNFVRTVIKDDFVIGFIRKWTYFCNEQKIVYDIGNYRYCSNIGRHHKSNNIKIVVDMKLKCFYQTCLDPECRKEGYHSDVKPLPCDIVFLNVPEDFFDADCFSQFQTDECGSNCCNEPTMDSFDKIFCEENSYQDWFSDLKDFTQLKNTGSSKNSLPTPYQLNPASWDAFFGENFSNENKENLDIKVASNDDLVLGDTWTFTPGCSEDNLDNVPLEDELLMAEAVEAAEIAMSVNGISEETVF